MDASTPQTPDLQRQQDRKRKRKALLAGGVVLGLGAAVTLAAWSDDVFADGTFNTGGTFELVGSTTYTGGAYDYKDYDGPTGPVAESAQLSFDINAQGMHPGETVYAPLTIATSSDTDKSGTFSLSRVEASGSYAPLLTYRVFKVDSHGENCNVNAADALDDQWTDPVNGVTTSIFSLLQSIPGIGNLITAVVGILPDTTSRPVLDPTVAFTGQSDLSVGSKSSTPQHLCIAVTMGLVPHTSTLGPLDPLTIAIDNLNETAVKNVVATDHDDDPDTPISTETSVTWVFTGEPS